MKGLGYGQGYKYAHDYEGNWVEQQYLPDGIATERFYIPGDNPAERRIAAVMASRANPAPASESSSDHTSESSPEIDK